MKTPNDSPGAAAPVPVQLINVTDIVPDPNNRKEHDKAELAVLAKSIERDGQLQPIIVRELKPGKFMLVAGERRWEAHRLLKRPTIEARVTAAVAEADAGRRDQIRKRAAENFHRVDLSPIEKAKALQELFDAKMSQTDIADFVGAKDQSTVSNFCRLLRLPTSVQKLIHEGTLSAAHGKAIVRFSRWPKACEIIASNALRQGESAKDLEQGIPYSWALKQKGLLVEIDTSKPYSFDSRPQYVVPPVLQQDPDFMKAGDGEWVCFAADKWAPEKARQDAEFVKAAKSAANREAGTQSKMSPTEKKARQKKIADNKAARAAILDTQTRATEQLAKTKEVTPQLVHVLADLALQGNYRYDDHIAQAAKQLGISVPKAKGSGEYRRALKFPQLQLMKPHDAARVAALAIITAQSEEAVKFASTVPEPSAHIAGKAKRVSAGKPSPVFAAAAKKLGLTTKKGNLRK